MKKLLALLVVVFVLSGGVSYATDVNLIAEAHQLTIEEQKQSKQNDLEKLFDSQIATLKERGIHKQIVEILQNQKGTVLARASKMTIGEGNTAFIPVIRPSYFKYAYSDLMSLVRNGATEGYTSLNPALITDKVETPNGLYYIYDVEDGEAMLGRSPETSEKLLKAERRSPLTAAEAIALATHTNVLSRHFVDATGSRDGSDDVPSLGLGGGRPRLGYVWADSAHSGWGSASCGSRY